MIAFLDTEVYAIEKDLLHKEDIDIYFSAEEHKEDILLLYEEGRYYGLICYQSFMNDRDSLIGRQNENYIIREKYIHKADDESLWNNLRDIFESTGAVYVPVFDEMENLLYFAYDDRLRKKEGFRGFLDGILKCENLGFFEHMDPEIKGIRIYDLNELGFLFWEIAVQKYHMPVETIGEKWEVLYPRSQNEKRIKDIQESNIAEYYPQSKSRWMVMHKETEKEINLLKIMHLIREDIVEDFKKHMEAKKIKMLTAYLGPYRPKTVDEEYRRLMKVTPWMTQHEWNQPLLYGQICKVEGSRISYEEWHSQFNKKEWEYININGKVINKKNFGGDQL